MAYSKQTWVRGEKVASVKLNHMEDGIATISANGAIDTANLADGAVSYAKLDAALKGKVDAFDALGLSVVDGMLCVTYSE